MNLFGRSDWFDGDKSEGIRIVESHSNDGDVAGQDSCVGKGRGKQKQRRRESGQKGQAPDALGHRNFPGVERQTLPE
ncbi:MAG: hypothetical protein KDI75_07155 [Xanthomonadales bacterium]|nr:hypothetical protein [Xanthomonadales bacterium]